MGRKKMTPEDHIKKIKEELEKIKGSKLSFIFAYLEEVNEQQVSVDSVYGGNYDQGILMLVTLMTHLHQITGSSFFEIFFDMGSQLAANELIRDKKNESSSEKTTKITDEEIKDKVITFMKKKDGKPDK
jgi:copper chaperone CopZ